MMTLRRVPSKGFVLPLLAALVVPPGLSAQEDKVAALKQSLSANQKLQKQYRWVETTVVSMKGEEKSRIQSSASMGLTARSRSSSFPPRRPRRRRLAG
jgi:hypothetical protein